MRKRVAGAAILVAVGIGIWLSSLFKGLGPGGAGDGFGAAENVLVSAEIAAPIDEGTAGESSSAVPSTPAVPTVLIDGHQYLLQVDAGAAENFRPVELDELVQLVVQAVPGEDGIRLHVKRRQSARASAESALHDALRKAGVEPQSIQEHKAFVQ